ncbi:MAG TPA: EamA family transporter [Actinomycetota bacterium]|nr:EamA family transporter [Actinomycetota bacterium]
MAALIFGLGAALAYGAADFMGGIASKRAGAVNVVLITQLLGTSVIVMMLPFFPYSGSVGPAIGWGAAAGVGGGAGVLLLYRGLARGRMSVVAPITGVEAAGVPVVFGLAIGERPGVGALIGVGLALIAVALVSTTRTEEAVPGRSGVPEAIGAGIGFGVFFICLAQAGDSAGLWPLIGARASSLVVAGSAAIVSRVRPSTHGAGREIAVASLLDVAANVFYLIGVKVGLLSLVAVLTSLYPAGTVALARIFLKERLGRIQVVGVGVAAAAVILIGIG